MPKLSDTSIAQAAINAILMGKPGVGKTALLSSFPRLRVFDFDKKIKSALNPDWLAKLGRVPDLEYQTFSEKGLVKGYAITHNGFDDACKWFDELMRPGVRDSFDYWGVDSVTSLTALAMNKALIILGGAKRSTTHDTASKTGLAMLQKQDFGGINSLIMQFLRMLLDSGKGVIAVVHEKELTNESGLLVSVDPMLIGQNVQAVPAMFQNVWHLRMEGVPPRNIRRLHTDFDGIRMARSEVGIGTIDEPTYDKILARLKQREEIKRPVGTPSTGGTQPPTMVALSKETSA